MRTQLKLRALVLTPVMASVVASAFVASDARAQGSNTSKPMPNVMLLVDTSGSMERMPDNSLPSANRDPVTGGTLPTGTDPSVNKCSPGMPSNPNRWGMLLQALTGNMQPFFSCAEMPRTPNSPFAREYQIANAKPYDTDYFLPYHRPLTGDAALDPSLRKVCAIGPHRLPGAAPGQGVGPNGYGYTGGSVTDFPDDAIASANFRYLTQQYGAGNSLGLPIPGSEECIFDQTPDGQLDAARDYVRFGLMTFDTDIEKGIGVNAGTWPPGGFIQTGGISPNFQPFAGQWSYLRDPTNPDYGAVFNTSGTGGQGKPDQCATFAPFEVGARHWGAPPWEGRMVLLPSPDASVYDVQKTNEQIQKVLLTSRPYGATPIDGMLDDARDYFWHNGLPGSPKNDPYVQGECREQYIILLTDGAPNLDLRPSCGTGIGVCPYPKTGAQTAFELYHGVSGKQVKTFVIGFSVNGAGKFNGDGFPSSYQTAPNNNCKAWYNGVGGTPLAMVNACNAASPPAGSTAEACCKLNELAYNGSGGAGGAKPVLENVGPFFAESQADIVLSFGKILASITHTATTRTLPGFTPTAYSSFGLGATTGQFIATFIPNAQKPWSGEIDRERFRCGTASGTLRSDPIPQDANAGDFMSLNVAAQGAANRYFITVVGDPISVSPGVGTPPSGFIVDSARTMRPFAPASGGDGIDTYSGDERGAADWELRNSTNFRNALEIDDTTCKKTKGVRRGSGGGRGSVDIPALTGNDCRDVVWGFTTAHAGSISKSGTPASAGVYDFNVRCTGSNLTQGTCSITGDSCTIGDPTGCAMLPGQVCVPECAALGAVYRSSPTIVGPPDGFLRDEGFRTFQAKRRNRRPAMFVQTTDGILHAFKAIEEQANAHHELWSFVPPAVLPKLASNYPAGNQVLLDGTPVVRETVWDRTVGDTDSSGGTPPGAKWHTTLVASLGQEGGGYYALNVSDVDCSAPVGTRTGECSGSGGYEKPAQGAPPDVAAGAELDGGAKRGPHFLWQLSDVAQDGPNDPAKIARQTKHGDKRVALFGRHTGTPAIATLQVRGQGGAERQIGVAILPGGVDNAPIPGRSCSRGGAAPANDPSFPPRGQVRQWATSCLDPVPGRGVTIVRLDNGQILRHFGRLTDVPRRLVTANVVEPTNFDSPMIGTPVVYPQTVGAVAQKIFIGDADGTIWRIDVSNTDPTQWRAYLFADLAAVDGNTAAESQPVEVPPTLTLDPGGALIVNAATGDQDSIIRKTGEKNYVWSVREKRPTGGLTSTAEVLWYQRLLHGERVTGPMVVFDRTLYFATFEPTIPHGAANCAKAGAARLWGLHYYAPGPGLGNGGEPMWCLAANVGPDGVCTAGGLVASEEVADQVIPGVSLRATQACSEFNSLTDEYGGTGYSQMSPSEYHLFFGIGKASGGSGSASTVAARRSVRRPLPRISTRIDAWSFVID